MSTGPQSAPVTRVGFVGGGIMGSGIAEVCAQADVDVLPVESCDAAAGRLGGKSGRGLYS